MVIKGQIRKVTERVWAESFCGKAITWHAWQDVVGTFYENLKEEIKNVEIPSCPIPASLAMKEPYL